ncbi:response regulator transcription factor [Ferviditalea candida]|uniref:Response regulator transcription factor n=1 Tax=Ferviditalea candida TaxID=3108399 RepID=A0ABU5ZDY2_9BACL|nr:response regulator transcription factor [Paenibacillaceae bacterium T2]
MKQLLLVEDEKIMAKNIKFFLEKEGYHIDTAFDGEQGLKLFQINHYDLLLLDWSLPGMDGLELCREIRRQSDVPIMMLTAKSEVMDKVIGLEVCADDYLTKPFHQSELLARIHVLLRRSRPSSEGDENVVFYEGIELDKSKLLVRYQGRSAALTINEFKLMEVMMRYPENVYSRDFLFETVWGLDSEFNDRTVDVNVSRLRRKLQELTDKRFFYAVRGMGYRFRGET